MIIVLAYYSVKFSIFIRSFFRLLLLILGQLALFAQSLISVLTVILVDYDCHAVGKIERASLRAHGNANAIGVVIVKKFFVKPLGLSAEKYPALLVVLHVGVVVVGLGGSKEELLARIDLGILDRQSYAVANVSLAAEVRRQERLHILVSVDVGYLPIVKSAALEIFVFPAESARLDYM